MSERVLPDCKVVSVHDERDAELIGTLDRADLDTLIRLKLLHPVRRTADGKVTEYRFSHTLRTLLNRI